MKTRFIPTLLLIAVLLAACAPKAVTHAPARAEALPTSMTPLVEVVQPTLAAATQVPAADAPTALPIATSRGPDLHATDPSTVSLASGELHFVEFFRFT